MGELIHRCSTCWLYLTSTSRAYFLHLSLVCLLETSRARLPPLAAIFPISRPSQAPASAAVYRRLALPLEDHSSCPEGMFSTSFFLHRGTIASSEDLSGFSKPQLSRISSVSYVAVNLKRSTHTNNFQRGGIWSGLRW